MTYNKIMEDNSFINNYKDAYSQKTQAKRNSADKAQENGSLLEEYFNIYNAAVKNRGGKAITREKFDSKFADMVGRMGIADNKWSQDDYDKKTYKDNDDYESYANDVLKTIMKKDANSAPDEVKEALSRLHAHDSSQWGWDAISQRSNERRTDDYNILDTIGSNFADIGDTIGSGFATVMNAPYNISQKQKDLDTLERHNSQVNDTAIAMFDDFDNYYNEYVKSKANNTNSTEEGKNSSGSATSNNETTNEDITFTIKSNDPSYKGFGQKIVDLGLATDKGLWGSDGDVQFYTKQLYDQGAVDSRGNLKVGVPITLKKRKNKQ